MENLGIDIKLLIAQLINFGIFFFIIAKFVAKPFTKFLNEERNKDEVIKIGGVQITKEDYNVYSPAFDVTPNELITGIITEAALHKPPYNF